MATTFCLRAKKTCPVAARETLHSKHAEMVKQFKAARIGVNAKRKALKQLQKGIGALDRQLPPFEDPEKTLALLQSMRGEAERLTTEIARVDANTDKDDYYALNGDLIFQYFNDKGPPAGCCRPSVVQKPIAEEEEEEGNPVVEPRKVGQQGVHDYFQLKENVGRKKILDKYMSIIYPEYVITVDRTAEEVCPECNDPLSTNTNGSGTDERRIVGAWCWVMGKSLTTPFFLLIICNKDWMSASVSGSFLRMVSIACRSQPKGISLPLRDICCKQTTFGFQALFPSSTPPAVPAGRSSGSGGYSAPRRPWRLVSETCLLLGELLGRGIVFRLFAGLHGVVVVQADRPTRRNVLVVVAFPRGRIDRLEGVAPFETAEPQNQPMSFQTPPAPEQLTSENRQSLSHL
jgi:hypothetical protein